MTLRCELGYRVFFRGHNLAHAGKSGGRTPAMRLGFTKAPLGFEDHPVAWAAGAAAEAGAAAGEEGYCGVTSVQQYGAESHMY